MNIPEKLSYKHQCGASLKSQCKDLLRMISTGSPQDLLTRISHRSCKDILHGGFHQDLYKSFLPAIVTKIVMPGPQRETHKSIFFILRLTPWTFSSTQVSRFRAPPADSKIRVFFILAAYVTKRLAAAGEDLTRSWYKSLPRVFQKSFHRSTSNTWHLQDLHHPSSRDLLERILPGSPPSTRSSDKDQDLHKIFL